MHPLLHGRSFPILSLVLVMLWTSSAGMCSDLELCIVYKEAEDSLKKGDYQTAITALNSCLEQEDRPLKINKHGGRFIYYLPYFKLACANSCLGNAKEADHYFARAEEEGLAQQSSDYRWYLELLQEPVLSLRQDWAVARQDITISWEGPGALSSKLEYDVFVELDGEEIQRYRAPQTSITFAPPEPPGQGRMLIRVRARKDALCGRLALADLSVCVLNNDLVPRYNPVSQQVAWSTLEDAVEYRFWLGDYEHEPLTGQLYSCDVDCILPVSGRPSGSYHLLLSAIDRYGLGRCRPLCVSIIDRASEAILERGLQYLYEGSFDLTLTYLEEHQHELQDVAFSHALLAIAMQMNHQAGGPAQLLEQARSEYRSAKSLDPCICWIAGEFGQRYRDACEAVTSRESTPCKQ